MKSTFKPYDLVSLGSDFADLWRLLPLKRRYVYTRNNKLRLRYTAPAIAVCTVLALSGLTSLTAEALSAVMAVKAEQSPAAASRVAAIAPAAGGELDDFAADSHGGTRRYLKYAAAGPGIKPETLQNAVFVPAPATKPVPGPREEVVKIGNGDTLAAVLQRRGITNQEIHNLVEALSEHYDPRQFRPGQKLLVKFDPRQAGGGYRFARMDVDLDALKTVSLLKAPDGTFNAEIHEKPTFKRQYAKSTEIEHSLYGSAAEAGIPAAVIAEAIRIYSWDVDFQRDIRKGDDVEMLYERIETEDGEALQSGDILYARLNINGRDIPVYRFEDEDGRADYYTPEGISIRRALLSTPVDGARISSGFGHRKHPVLGYTKLHKGTDFAAPTGTPIYAAGDGIVERANRFSSYGNYIRLRHNGSLKTAYAHLNGFAKGISAGTRVKQGQVIGYIGTTGRSTGPHLHYEVLMNGEQVNPRSVKVPQGKALKGTQLAAFKAQMQRLNKQYAEVKGSVKYAALKP